MIKNQRNKMDKQLQWKIEELEIAYKQQKQNITNTIAQLQNEIKQVQSRDELNIKYGK